MLLILVLFQVIVYIYYYSIKLSSVFVNTVMSLSRTEGEQSDDEVFFGKMTLVEVKKRLFRDIKPCASSLDNSPRDFDDPNASLKILETHSVPNLLSYKNSCDQDFTETCTPGWDMTDDDSFIKLENMVNKLCVSPDFASCTKTEELNNTSEVIEYILNNPPSDTKVNNVNTRVETGSQVLDEISLNKLLELSPQKSTKEEQNILKDSTQTPRNTPVKSVNKYGKEVAGFMTPVDKGSKPVFKTPAQPVSHKKPVSSCKKTPNYKSNAYEHIMSPVAFYIRNSPSVPLVQDVHPKKPLPGPSSIPKFKSLVPIKPSNKENVNLPSVAYKSAKITKMVKLQDERKLPQSQWAKKMMTSLPRPVVIKHDHRELNLVKRKLPQQEDSFADLSYHQAEVSVCIQKSAQKSNKNV